MGVDGADDDADNDAKYVKRQSALQRSMKRFFPAAFQPTLPVTTRYAKTLPLNSLLRSRPLFDCRRQQRVSSMSLRVSMAVLRPA